MTLCLGNIAFASRSNVAMLLPCVLAGQRPLGVPSLL